MCTKEEVVSIVSASEARQMERLEKSHQAIGTTISNLMGDEKEERKETKEMIAQILEQTTKTNGKVTCLETWKATHTIEYLTLVEKIDDVRSILSLLNKILITAVAGAILSLVIIK
jgi:hypothetical protein